MQVCQDLDDISVLELYREYQGTIAAAVDFILIYEDENYQKKFKAEKFKIEPEVDRRG